MSTSWARWCYILFKTALRLSQVRVIRNIFRPSHLIGIIHILKPWLGLELFVFFSRLISTFQLTKSNYSIQHLLVNIPLLMLALGTMHLRQLHLITPAVLMPQSHRYRLHIHSHPHKLVSPSQMAARVNHSICGKGKVGVSIPRKRPSTQSPN